MISFILVASLAVLGEEAPREAESPASIEAEVHRRFLKLEALMNRLLAALKEPSKGGRLQAAIGRARELKISDRLDSVKELLEKRSFVDALGEEKVLEKDLERILGILRGEDPTEAARERTEEMKRVEEQLQRLERLIDQQKKINEETAGAEKGSEKEIARQQAEIQAKTEELRRTIERKMDALKNAQKQGPQGQQGQKGQKDQQGEQGQEGQEGQQGQQGKEGQQGQEGQQGKKGQQGQQGKKGQQGQQGKKGQEGQQGQKDQQDQQNQEQAEKNAESGSPQDQEDAEKTEQLSRNSLRNAAKRMGGAAQRMEAGNKEGAMEDQEEALEQLQNAQEKMEREQARRAEERRQAMAQAVLGRIQLMLSECRLVRTETEAAEVKKRDKGEKALSEETLLQDSRGLARRERALTSDSDDIIRILEEEGSTVVAPSILRRVNDDLENAAGLLDGGETGETTRTVQVDIEKALEELVEAIRPPQRPRGGNRGSGSQPGEGGGEGEGGEGGRKKTLITPVMEIRMLASAQRRIRARTDRLPAVPVEERAGQQTKISEAQKALEGLTQKVEEKYPVVDQFLLGEDIEEEHAEHSEHAEPEGPEEPARPKSEEQHEDH